MQTNKCPIFLMNDTGIIQVWEKVVGTDETQVC